MENRDRQDVVDYLMNNVTLDDIRELDKFLKEDLIEKPKLSEKESEDTAQRHVYVINCELTDVLINDESAKIVVIDKQENNILINDFIKGAKSLTIKTYCNNLTIKTIGDKSQYFEMNTGLLSKDKIEHDIKLNPKVEIEQNKEKVPRQLSIMEMKEQLGLDNKWFENEIKKLMSELRRLGNNEYIGSSINCWIATRLNGASASMVCDYVELDMVRYLDNHFYKNLNKSIEINSPLKVKELINHLETNFKEDDKIFFGNVGTYLKKLNIRKVNSNNTDCCLLTN